MRLVVALTLVTFAALPARAQSDAGRPRLVLAGGVAGQLDGDHTDLGSPGLSGAIGVELPIGRRIAFRAEAQGFDYPEGETSLDVWPAAAEPAERVVGLTAAAVWRPTGGRVYLLGGGGILRASARRNDGMPLRSASIVAGAGLSAWRRVGLEGQYLHAARALGGTDGVLAARIVVRL